MFAEERLQRIVELVNRQGKVTVAGLSEALSVSPVTIRRDLEGLEQKGLLMRTHGGAMPVQNSPFEVAREMSFDEKGEALVAEKERIAEAAARLVHEEEAILLTPGTTNMFLAQKLSGIKELTVVTNAANIAVQLSRVPGFDVMLIGGKMRPKSYALVGPMADQALRGIRVDKLFLGVDGFDIEEGLTTPNILEASVNAQMIAIAKQVIVVADHSKFGKVTFSRIAGLDSVHTIVSDRMLPEAACERIREMGIELILA
ncbi:DeoR/GlpR family DNA-binding transcription regulator [Paenibacillus sp. MBLB4367]|uniref:DeoR/GlpR family DNA-binding transcription regulator n=1 Tax=Paenibacillus sp. MBLB4367 TaxID=3384767 RepID=UPI0039080F23